MKNNTLKFHSLSRRIVSQFCIFTLILSAFYGFFCFIFLYTLEDAFIEREITQEAAYLCSEYQATNQWPNVRNANMALYFSKTNLPADLKSTFIEEPNRREFYGDEGRHYHLYLFPEHPDVHLVAEVSQKLLVRPVREGIVQFFLASGIVLTIIAFFIAYTLGRKTARPLKALADLVDGVAPKNIPNTFAHQFPNNEIGILARTLEDSMQQISKTLEREKCFTRDASHELRTPVAIVKNAVELYQEKNRGNDKNNDIIARISQAAMQMEQTVSTLLILAREEQVSTNKVQIKLLPLVEQSIIDHSYLLQGKQVDVQVSERCHSEVLAQAGMLKVLLDNLISNAFQYTDSGEVSVDVIDEKLIIKNTGAGIEHDISATITEPAVKGSQSTGYGFGLSIVKRLCEHQGWELSVLNDKDTTIVVSFTPLA
ncbi:HAMP domain-containing sensor histidine kinase [Psychrobium sp. 1_MG-2023]|uniref:sensor histidine kinase n=1 Tax=Psychrobium sp. 1_MG-2023 TaxID=3062624 RepID=UPI000C325C55|nr:HAMP domain-containing sensor histidine kinase [Psychrobium sp. 1_MG-2023]MDP2561914.1 HAMP domain-containing sensor histidine kinase [Psychrobium sp. 1_MG-2023]PKF59672.1 two-component sensor histidine kinase [Alteromonadales bacterium alter-6D02]